MTAGHTIRGSRLLRRLPKWIRKRSAQLLCNRTEVIMEPMEMLCRRSVDLTWLRL